MLVRVPRIVHDRARERQKIDLARGIKRQLWEYIAEEHRKMFEKPGAGFKL